MPSLFAKKKINKFNSNSNSKDIGMEFDVMLLMKQFTERMEQKSRTKK